MGEQSAASYLNKIEIKIYKKVRWIKNSSNNWLVKMDLKIKKDNKACLDKDKVIVD
jgi:hypothetical protein